MFEARSKVESRILSRSLSIAISCSRDAFSLSSVASCFVRQLAANGPSSLVNLLRAARAPALRPPTLAVTAAGERHGRIGLTPRERLSNLIFSGSKWRRTSPSAAHATLECGAHAPMCHSSRRSRLCLRLAQLSLDLLAQPHLLELQGLALLLVGARCDLVRARTSRCSCAATAASSSAVAFCSARAFSSSSLAAWS